MDVSSSYLSKNLLPPSGILLVRGHKRSPKFVRYFEILIVVAAAQSNALLFALGGKFKLKKNQPIRSHYSKYSILIGPGTDLFLERDFVRFESSGEIRPSLKRQQQHKFNSIKMSVS